MLGKHHPTVRAIRRLRRDPAAREAEGVFIAEGFHLAREALDANAEIVAALASPELEATREGRALAARLAARSIDVDYVAHERLERLQDARSAQPISLVVRRTASRIDGCESNARPARASVVLFGVQDPGNLGSILRTAAAAGIDAFVVAPGCADVYHPRTVRASMGAIFRLVPRVARDDGEAIALARRPDRALVATVVGGGTAFRAFDWSRPVAIAFGSEGSGLPRSVERAADHRVSIPLANGVESLSVAAAAAIVLFEVVRPFD